MDALKRLVPQIKDLAEQTPGPLVIICANGQGTPLYADEYEVIEGLFVAFRGSLADPSSFKPIYSCAVADARFYAVDVVHLRVAEDLQRDAADDDRRRRALRKALGERIVQTPRGPVSLPPEDDEEPEPTVQQPGQYL